MMFKRKNKFNAKRVGKFDSTAESEYDGVLELLKKAGEIADYEHHPPPVTLAGCITWKVDFMVEANDGTMYYVEVKGYTKTDRNYKKNMALWRWEIPAPLFVVTKYGPNRFRLVEEIGTEGIEFKRV